MSTFYQDSTRLARPASFENFSPLFEKINRAATSYTYNEPLSQKQKALICTLKKLINQDLSKEDSEIWQEAVNTIENNPVRFKAEENGGL